MSCVAALLIEALIPAGVASAHTSFLSSSPADGETISEPLDAITLRFSGETEYADGGFTVLTADGEIRTPNSVTSTDQKTFELTFDPALAGDEIGLRWKVNAPDAHTIDGSFSFAVTAPALAGASPAEPVPAAASASEADPRAMTGSDDMTMNDAGEMVMSDGATMEMPAASLDEFLTTPESRSGEGTSRWGRLLELATITLIIGGVAFTATTLRGQRTEITQVVTVLRMLGATLALGAALEYVGITRLAESSIAD